MKSCISCGMPMKSKEDYPLADESKDYCVHCAKPDGSMQSYDEKLESMTNFIVKTQGFDRQAANNAARSLMAKLPAWNDQK